MATSVSPVITLDRATRMFGATALDVALDIARRHGAALTLVHVIPWLSRRVAEGLPAGVEADLHRWVSPRRSPRCCVSCLTTFPAYVSR